MSELHKFIFDGLPVRGMVVRLTDAWREILRRRAGNTATGAYPAPVRELLGEMAKIAAASHAPFISAGAPTTMQMGSWQELANPRDLTKIFTTPEYAAWRSLRESDDARYLAMCMPRFSIAQAISANCRTSPSPFSRRSSGRATSCRNPCGTMRCPPASRSTKETASVPSRSASSAGPTLRMRANG